MGFHHDGGVLGQWLGGRVLIVDFDGGGLEFCPTEVGGRRTFGSGGSFGGWVARVS